MPACVRERVCAGSLLEGKVEKKSPSFGALEAFHLATVAVAIATTAQKCFFAAERSQCQSLGETLLSCCNFFLSDSTIFWQQRQFQAEHEEKSPACSGREVHPICEDDNQTLTSRALGTGEERHSHRKRVGEILRPNCLGKILKRQNLITQTESF